MTTLKRRVVSCGRGISRRASLPAKSASLRLLVLARGGRHTSFLGNPFDDAAENLQQPWHGTQKALRSRPGAASRKTPAGNSNPAQQQPSTSKSAWRSLIYRRFKLELDIRNIAWWMRWKFRGFGLSFAFERLPGRIYRCRVVKIIYDRVVYYR